MDQSISHIDDIIPGDITILTKLSDCRGCRSYKEDGVPL
jgi:hypothetical protein